MPVRILFNNLFAAAPTIIASDEDIANNGAKENAFDGLPRDWWKTTAAGNPYLEFDMGAGNTASFDSLGLYSFDFAGGQVAMQYSDDLATWTDVIPAFTPATDVVFSSVAAPVTHRAGRILVTGATGPISVGHVAIGSKLEYAYGPQIGFRPPIFQTVKGKVNMTAGGYQAGSDTVPVPFDYPLTFDLMDPAEMRTLWAPFFEVAKLGTPFILSWDEVNHPDEAVFCSCEPNKVLLPQYSDATFMSVQMHAKGRIIN